MTPAIHMYLQTAVEAVLHGTCNSGVWTEKPMPSRIEKQQPAQNGKTVRPSRPRATVTKEDFVSPNLIG